MFSSFLAYDLKSKLEDWRDKIDSNLVRMIEAGLSYSGQDIMRALDLRKKIYEAIYKNFKKFDILLTPNNALPAFSSKKFFPEKIGGKKGSLTGWVNH